MAEWFGNTKLVSSKWILEQLQRWTIFSRMKQFKELKQLNETGQISPWLPNSASLCSSAAIGNAKLVFSADTRMSQLEAWPYNEQKNALIQNFPKKIYFKIS